MRTVDRRRLILIAGALVLASCTSGPLTGAASTPGPNGSSGSAIGPTGSPSSAPSATAPATTSAPPSPSATPAPSAAGSAPPRTAPPKPTDTTYVLVKETVSSDQLRLTERFRATWTEPEGVATGFRVYGVTACLRESAKNDNKPCVVPGMTIPSSKLKLLATATGSARSVDVTWTRDNGEGPDPYWAILLSAVNPSGESKSAILTSGLVCFQCVY